MSDEARPASMAEVLRLSTALAEQMLEAQAAHRPIPKNQFEALVRAARLLQGNNVPWPPPVREVVHEIAKRIEAANATPTGDEAEG